MAFFVFINCVLVLSIAAGAPQVLYVVIRVFGGTVISLLNHIYKGFNLYDELSVKELHDGRDSEALYFMRIFFLYVCVGFTIYLSISCVCLCSLGGLDGNGVRNVINPNEKFKRVPFGNLVF